MGTIDYWFSVGSTYNFLSLMRLDEIEKKYGVQFRWRPFSMWKILHEMGHVPFADKPAKLAYMWRDIARRAEARGIKAKLPAPYPAKRIAFGIQVAFLGMREGWGKEFVKNSYTRLYFHGEEPYEDPGLSDTLNRLGQDVARVLQTADGEDNLRLLEEETNEARRLGLFGSPSFVVDGEVFWGDDRLEDAIAWRQHGTLKR
ncbi:MAG: DsbA family protein [Alphaproteobacteria bacterium]|nr:DsbA family protein [Alphaproteobacteria bacterium]MCW5742636.1 DsbA family protein [Alphaproteobacteria bacterium]